MFDYQKADVPSWSQTCLDLHSSKKLCSPSFRSTYFLSKRELLRKGTVCGATRPHMIQGRTLRAQSCKRARKECTYKKCPFDFLPHGCCSRTFFSDEQSSSRALISAQMKLQVVVISPGLIYHDLQKLVANNSVYSNHAQMCQNWIHENLYTGNAKIAMVCSGWSWNPSSV
jgi:hypothetical protein